MPGGTSYIYTGSGYRVETAPPRFLNDWRMLMSNTVLIVLLVVLVMGMAVLGALALIGLAVYRSRTKRSPAPKQDLDAEQVNEITSTNILNQ